jgi:hypothetical protein
MMAMLMGLTVLSLVRTIVDSNGGEPERDREICKYLNFDPNFDLGKDRRQRNKDHSRESEVGRCQTLLRR